MKKAILFVDGKLSTEMATEAAKIKSEGFKVVVSNGSISKGFEDSCDKVFLEKDFEHVSNWCKRVGKDFEVLGSKVVETKATEETDEEEEKEEKPATRRGRKPKAESEEEK